MVQPFIRNYSQVPRFSVSFTVQAGKDEQNDLKKSVTP